MVDHTTNTKGELLARVWETSAFKEVYDYTGLHYQKGELKRVCEKASNRYDSEKQFFQRLYYHPDLTASDEEFMRTQFVANSQIHDRVQSAISGGMFVAYFPLTMRLAMKYRPVTLVAWTGFYYFGLHNAIM